MGSSGPQGGLGELMKSWAPRYEFGTLSLRAVQGNLGVDAHDMARKLQRTIGVEVQQGLGAYRDWGHTLGESSDPEG